MKTKRIYRIILPLVLIFAGCTDVLDVKPVSSITSESFWNTKGDAESYLIGIYDKLRDITNTFLYGEDRGDTFEAGNIGPTSPAWAQSLSANAGSAWGGFSHNWAPFYNFVYHVNRLLKETENIEFSQPDKDRIMAEGYALRALIYFHMAKVWGDVPLIIEPTENADVELKARSPVSQVFDQINSDINMALGLFPEDDYVDKNRMSKPATYALLADVKIWTGKVLDGGNADFNAALNAIAQVEASGVQLLSNYRDVILTSNKKNDEIIFAIFFENYEQDAQYGRGLATRGENIAAADNFSECNYTDRNHARAVYAPSRKLMNLFAQNPGDTREPVAIIHALFTNPLTGTVDTMLTTFNKFRGKWYEDRYYDDDTPVYRFGDIVLLKAEALAALGRTAEAITELNKTRNRAQIGDYTGPTDQQSVEMEILDDRWRELVVENKRWYDLVRFHYGGTINIYNVVPNMSGKDGIPLYFPVHQSVLDNNDKITQTPGY